MLEVPLTEQITPMGDGFIAFCLDQTPHHAVPAPASESAYAFWWNQAGERIDVSTLFLGKMQPDPREATAKLNLSKAQQKLAREAGTDAEARRHQKNFERFSREAELHEKGCNICPNSVTVLDDTRVLLGFQESSQQAGFRVVNIVAGQIEWEQKSVFILNVY